jgi:hypothetical protein
MTSVYELSRSIINRKSVQTFNTAASTLLSRFENDDLEDYERRVRRGNQYRKYMLHVPSLARELFFLDVRSGGWWDLTPRGGRNMFPFVSACES